MGLVYGGLGALFFLKYIVRSKKANCVIIGIFLFSLASFRNYTGDVARYMLHFAEVQNFGLLAILQGQGFAGIRDVTFYAVARLFGLLGLSVEVWIAAIALTFAISVSVFLYKYADNEWIGLLVVMAFYFRFTLTGLRQAMALSFVLFSYQYILQRNFKKFILFLLIAAAFHISAVVFLPAYFIAKIKMGIKQLIVLLGSTFVVMIFPQAFRAIVSVFSFDERLTGYATSQTALTWSGFIIFFSIWFFCYILRMKGIIDPSYEYDAMLNLIMVGVILQGASAIVAESFRLGYYYNIASIACLPNAISRIRTQTDKRTVGMSVCGVILIYMLVNNMYAKFSF